MNNDEIELLIDEDGDNYYVLKNSSLDLNNANILNHIDGTNILNNKKYFKNKLIHREDGPAIEYNNGKKEWYKNGLKHRKNGPAIEYANGDQEYWINGKLHRENEPASIIGRNKFWYKNGLLHREDGPAIEWGNGKLKQYCINGIQISEENFYLEKELRDSMTNRNLTKKNKI